MVATHPTCRKRGELCAFILSQKGRPTEPQVNFVITPTAAARLEVVDDASNSRLLRGLIDFVRIKPTPNMAEGTSTELNLALDYDTPRTVLMPQATASLLVHLPLAQPCFRFTTSFLRSGGGGPRESQVAHVTTVLFNYSAGFPVFQCVGRWPGSVLGRLTQESTHHCL